MSEFYPMFASWAKSFGVEQATNRARSLVRLSGGEVAVVEEMALRYQADVAKIESGGPAIIAAGKPAWYSGPSDGSIYWPPVGDFFVNEENWPAKRMADLNRASNIVVAHTPRTDSATFNSRGLVVGYVQSGKTTNFISVIAKMADENYRLIIVLSGVHNGLRKQTQQRLSRQLSETLPEKWKLLTDETRDFHAPPGNPLATLTPDQTAVAVVKKNAAVLTRLVKWLELQPSQQALRALPVLIIDDEADQASVATKSINPLIRRLLKLAKKCTYIGYTATPFANVFIDPASEDLYPKDFILNLPRPEGYFGPEKIFGRDIVEGEDDEPDAAGRDMIRVVPPETLNLLRPSSVAEVSGFAPSLTSELKDAIIWFWLATAIRRHRGDVGHSTMLMHVSERITVQEAYRQPLLEYRDQILTGVKGQDADILQQIRRVWDREAVAVPRPDAPLDVALFEQILNGLPPVIESVHVIVDNYRSKDRLNYGDEPQIAIAVGGNTLSRGLTLEGLVVSFFVRTARAYDTLLQMGRWFGYRPGYEDLPRIWMTEELRLNFRHLASVEAEMRADIEGYQRVGLTPMDLAVKIRTHPALQITAKMGAAQPQFISFAGRRLQTRFFKSEDPEWLGANRVAADKLIRSALKYGQEDVEASRRLVRDVPARIILDFFESYSVHEDSPDLDPALIRKYIETQTSSGGGLDYWTIAIMESDAGQVPLGGINVRGVTRSKLDDGRPGRADIKTLMSRRDRVLDLDVRATEAGTLTEPELMALRNSDALHKSRGLLVVYPIEPMSPPMDQSRDRVPLDAQDWVVGIGIVFPGEASAGTRLSATHLAVPLDDVALLDEAEAYETDTEEPFDA